MRSPIRYSPGRWLGLFDAIILFAVILIGHAACDSDDVQAPVNQAPQAVTLVEPDSGAVDVPTNPTLTWMGGEDADGDSVAFDVYLGTNEPLPLVGTTGDTSLTVTTGLPPMTDFFWRVVARDPAGASAQSATWVFTTGTALNLPPSAPSDPVPGSVSINVPLDTNLSWAGGVDPNGDPVTFDVYLGTTNPPPFIQNQAASPYDPPANLDSSTTYYWRIVAKDNQGGETSGPLWTFVTGTTP
jgi:hypothetical protein